MAQSSPSYFFLCLLCLLLISVRSNVPCNGDQDFCLLPLSKYTFAGTHNSGASAILNPTALHGVSEDTQSCFFDNQERNYLEQLDNDIRMLSIDVCIIPEEARQPVPDSWDGACDHSSSITASCNGCAKYYDTRTVYGNTPESDKGWCVYVPANGVCFPDGHAATQGMDIDLTCHQASQRICIGSYGINGEDANHDGGEDTWCCTSCNCKDKGNAEPCAIKETLRNCHQSSFFGTVFGEKISDSLATIQAWLTSNSNEVLLFQLSDVHPGSGTAVRAALMELIESTFGQCINTMSGITSQSQVSCVQWPGVGTASADMVDISSVTLGTLVTNNIRFVLDIGYPRIAKSTWTSLQPTEVSLFEDYIIGYASKDISPYTLVRYEPTYNGLALCKKPGGQLFNEKLFADDAVHQSLQGPSGLCDTVGEYPWYRTAFEVAQATLLLRGLGVGSVNIDYSQYGAWASTTKRMNIINLRYMQGVADSSCSATAPATPPPTPPPTASPTSPTSSPTVPALQPTASPTLAPTVPTPAMAQTSSPAVAPTSVQAATLAPTVTDTLEPNTTISAASARHRLHASACWATFPFVVFSCMASIPS